MYIHVPHCARVCIYEASVGSLEDLLFTRFFHLPPSLHDVPAHAHTNPHTHTHAHTHQLPSSQAQVSQQHNPMRPQNKYTRQRPSNVPSFQFQPLAQRGMPVFYPPQQAAIMTDPSWYYNNMMLYQVHLYMHIHM